MKIILKGSGWKKFIKSILLLLILVSILGQASGGKAQTETPPQVIAMLSSMTPEERVGQLFLVSFRGTDTGEESPIHDLIANYNIGGVVLAAKNDNFIAEPDTIASTHELISNLQTIEWTATLSGGTTGQVYVPLFIGISQEGDGIPNDQLLSGMTPLPNEMAIGATWKTDAAFQVGSIMGSELSSIGFNMFLGPSLDVVEAPSSSASNDLGTRVFGGDPFWVGKIGKAYVSGLHTGSDNRMIVIAKHFPGRGGSDRSPEQEVATVRKSLEQLKLVELAPFFAVTDLTDTQSMVDGLLVSHIRYQGFQGNIRATTRPVSFDASALSVIFELPQFATWRENGGLVVSDDLSSDAVRDFYSAGGETFLPRIVARDAFLAGNDLLFLGDISSVDANSYETAIRVLNLFAQEYRNDAVFAQTVDEAVKRILTHKVELYPNLNIQNVNPKISSLNSIGDSRQIAFEVARDAVALISPDPQELNTLLPAPPTTNDRIVFITDVSTYRQCSTCQPHDLFSVDLFQNTVLRLFGPDGSGQVLRNRVSSYSLQEVRTLLDDVSETDIESGLVNAAWVVISLTDVSQGQVDILRRLFSERPNLVRNKNVVLFSFTAPYYLDATDISKLSAYYALYSKEPAFVDVAARVLFQQISVSGSSPVSIPAVGYDLIKQTSPGPNTIIPLQLDQSQPADNASEPATTPEPTVIPSYKIGDSISVRAGPVLDHNNHLVPDQTVVRFTLSTRDESGNILRQVDATTTNGIARASFVIDKPGKVEIRAVSEPALVSEVLQFDATDAGVAVTVVVPVLSPAVEEVIPTQTLVEENNFISPEGYPRPGIWILVLLGVFGSAFLTYWAVSRIMNIRWGVRYSLCVLIGGFGAYNYLALGFPRALKWISSESGGPFGVLLFSLAGEAFGIIVAWVWWRWFSESKSQAG